MSEKEYISLREELISRINITNTLAMSAASFSTASWAVGIALLVIPYNDNVQALQNNTMQSILYLIPAFFAFATILVLIPFAIKSSENIFQSTAISCYLQVFYEHNLSDGAWETINTTTNLEKMDSGLYHNFSWLFNAEYAFLSFVSILLYLFSTLAYVTSDVPKIVDYKVLTVLGLFAGACVTVIFIITLTITHSRKNINSYILEYIKKGKKFQILTDNDCNNLMQRFDIKQEDSSEKDVPRQKMP